MNYQPAAPVAWELRLAAVVLFAAQAVLGYATYGDRAGTAAAHMRADVYAFGAYWAGSGVPGNNPACADKKLDADDDVDQTDFGIFQRCYSGTELALPECTGAGGGLPASGTFVMHGRPVDVLPDGHVLVYVRARFYDPGHARWLQRDPTGYADGANLYEAFGANPLANSDPSGTQIWVTERTVRTEYGSGQAWAVTYTLHRSGPDLGLLVWLFGGTEETTVLGTEYYAIPPGRDSRVPDRHVRNLSETQRKALEDRAVLGDDIARLQQAIRVSAATAVGLPVAAVAAPAATTAFSTTTVGITTTTVGGNIAAASLTGAVSLGAGGAVTESLVGGDAKQILMAGLEHAAIGGVTGGVLGTALPTGTFSVVTNARQAVVIATVRMPSARAAGPAEIRLVHLTSEEGFAQITRSGQLIGRHGIFAVPEGVMGQGTALRVFRTGLGPAKTVRIVPIPESATPLFSRPAPVGPYSAWKYFTGVQYAPPGSINTATGGFIGASTLVGPRTLIYGMDAFFYGAAATASGTYWWLSGEEE